MFSFGLELVGPNSQVTRAAGDPTTSGVAFPTAPTNGQVWFLTADVGQFKAGMYVFSEFRASWVNQLQSVNPYDVGVSLLKRYAAGAEVASFLSVRTTAIAKNFRGSKAVADVAATAATTFYVRIVDAASAKVINIGSFTFPAGGTVATFTSEAAFVDKDIILVSGDKLKIFAGSAVDSTIAGIAATIAGRLLV